MKINGKRRNGIYGTRQWMQRLAEIPNKKWNYRKGEYNPRAKLSPLIVNFIHTLDKIPRSLALSISRVLNIHPSYVYHLKSGRRWSHLK